MTKQMTIDDMIETLQSIKAEHGNLKLRDANGNDLYIPDAVYVVGDPDTNESRVYFQCEESVYG